MGKKIFSTSKARAELFAQHFALKSTLDISIDELMPSVTVVSHNMPDILFKFKPVRNTSLNFVINITSELDTPILINLFQTYYDKVIFPD